MLPNFLSPKGLSYSNLKPEILKRDSVLDMIICQTTVYLGRDNKLGSGNCGNRFVRGTKKGFETDSEEGFWCLLERLQTQRKTSYLGKFYGQSPGQLFTHDLFVQINGRLVLFPQKKEGRVGGGEEGRKTRNGDLFGYLKLSDIKIPSHRKQGAWGVTF